MARPVTATEQDAQWLISLQALVDSPLPAPCAKPEQTQSIGHWWIRRLQQEEFSNHTERPLFAALLALTRLRWSHQQRFRMGRPRHTWLLPTRTSGRNFHRPLGDCMALPNIEAYWQVLPFSDCTVSN
jgi:hypothetical protein